MILLDTNILVYALDAVSAHHQASRNVVERIQAGSLEGGLVPQVLLETYAIVTDRRRVERPLTPMDASTELDVLARSISVFYPGPRSMTELVALLRGRSVSGQNVFDIFLVAQMREHGIETICTLNAGDFVGFGDLEILTPDQLL